MGLLIFFVGFALGTSFFCSLLEAALLSVTHARLTQAQETGGKGAAILLDFKQHRVDDAIAAILTVNTIANTLGATLAGAQAAKVFGSTWVGLFSGVLAFLVLIVSEIIPKIIGTVYASALIPFVGWSLAVLTWAMRPALFLSRLLTRLLIRGKRATTSRADVEAVVDLATRTGAVSVDESAIFGNVLRITEILVEDVMTPRTVTTMLPADTPIGEMISDRAAEPFSRVPIYEEDEDDVVGYVLQREVLKALAKGADPAIPLSRFAREIDIVPETLSVGQCLRRFLERREPISLVVDEHGSVSGLLTLEDITETLLGVEIVDESDRVADLRTLATRLRDRRMDRLHRQVGVGAGGAAD
ncbi:MAG: DUF21 domain-containing protein [Acidobacteria bacterium]|nr:DUF21 domain-containing protein [Acidobacteriota bacterium]